ncbi:MAG: alpha/beta hydrolase [Chloroflexota bacterium]
MKGRLHHQLLWLAITLLVTVGLLASCTSLTPPSLPSTAPAAPQSAPPKTETPPFTTPGPPALAPSPSPQPLPLRTGNFTLIRDIEYGKGGGTPLRLDIYMPKTPLSTPMPAVVWIHGGGWQGGDKYPTQATTLANRGFFVISINYRLSGVAPFPAAIEDCKCAIRWLRANAGKYNVDPDRIGVWGGSAGGHLSLLVGTADASAGLEGSGGWADYSSRVQAICSFYGPSDFVSWYQDNARFGRTLSSAETKFLGGTMEQKPEVYKQASPVTWVSADDPPLLMVHGDRDQTVPIQQSQIMYDAYKALGLDATLIKVVGAGHGFVNRHGQPPISPSPQEIDQAVYEFFLKHLGEKATPAGGLSWQKIPTPDND